MKFSFLFSPLLLVAIISCNKDNTSCPTEMKLTIDNVAPTIGSTFTITAPKETTNSTYQWSGPRNTNGNISNTLTFNDVKYSNRGWYYCTKSNTGCGKTLRDSIYVDVKLKQETPVCTSTNNYVSSSNLTNPTFATVTQGIDPTFNGMSLFTSPSQGFSYFRVLFNSYFGNFEPVDGVYTTTDRLGFDVTQEYNDVSVSFLWSGIFYHCQPNQKLYVSHLNGKLQVTFCSMIFSSGSTPLTTCTGKITKT